ncbi:helix-turn-helix transcriptional regulator [Planotetraspora thailandica]|uniref:Helix-turn-helix transcriptional regulator n=1 Tax=Planotetraspora thailandica TaxID=487172 RepID=A0A8J3V9P9_9ACTN|nr:AAA family ATPase [Planotetraspora thailandica]GII56684.1 helix-turn-helix transcriptional regulator [Planotetraspora thailandica]
MRIDDVTLGLIGRDHPAAMVRAEIGRAAQSHGGLVLVTGEAGIGKTALVTGAAHEARRLGALVLGGSCWDSDNAPGYWPWVQVLRGVRRVVTPQEWAAAQGAAGGGLAALLGESSGGDVADGFPLYDAVTSALVFISQSRPVVVVLDDLHWADAASLKLLEFAARHTWFERLLLIGTYRDVEVDHADHPLRPLLLPLAARATTITLTGLDRDGVGALMARTAGQEPSADLVEEVHLRTGGNPFFVEQTARLWRSGGSVATIAPGVRDTLLRRLSLLPMPVVELLTTAAVLGREFHLQLLAATAASPVAHADRLLGQAVAARLVVSKGGAVFAFAHDLVRETLQESLDEHELARRHAAVLRAAERSPDLADRAPAADLARHAYLAGDHVEPARAIERLLAAAHDAVKRMATEEAAGHYRRALDLAAGGEPRRRVMIALDFGREVCHWGDRDVGTRALEEAAAAARESGDPELLARVALTVHGAWGDQRIRQLGADLLIEAYGTLIGAGSLPDAGASLSRLAQELAVHLAVLDRRGDDDEALAMSLWARHNTIWGPGTAPERVALTDELLDLARRTADVEMESAAASLRWVALLEQGDPRYLDQFHEYIALSRRDDMPRLGLATAADLSIIAALMGRFDEAEGHLHEVDGITGQITHDPFAFMVDHHRWAVRLLQGRFDDLDDLHGALLQSGHPCPGLLKAMTELRRGNLDPARRYLADATARGEPRSRSTQSLWLRFQAMVAAATRDAALCDKARADIEPYADGWAVALHGWDVGGPMTFWIALVDAAQERWDAAVNGFAAAASSADLLQARPWSIEARAQLAEVLLSRGEPEDEERAARLLDDVESEAAQLGMPHVVDGARRARLRIRTPGDAGELDNTFRRDGDVWSLGFAGRTVHLPDAKGLRDLHQLLSHPGADLPAVRLLDPEAGPLLVAARRLGADPVLDEEAKAGYRSRLDRLDEEIDRAARLGDDRKAAELDREREALLAELRSAAGLGGRDRRLGDESERARKTVSARIRDALRRLDRVHPELAAHLRAAVSTGTTCRYEPGQEISWRC